MSLAERYSRAARSSDLELKVEVGDVDYLIAAGLVRDTLPTRLIRLRAEFDAVHRNRSVMRLMASFAGAREYLLAHAIKEAWHRSALDAEKIAEVALRVLDLFLDPNCPACSGRGFNGEYGAPSLRCTNCRETGKRAAFWKTEPEEAFAKWLQSSIEGKVDVGLAQMRRFLKERG